MSRTDLGKVFQKIIEDGVRRLAQEPGVAQTLWQVPVRAVDAASGTVILGAGARDRLKPGQLFTVFARSPGDDACDVYLPLAHVRTTANVEQESAEARVERLDSSTRSMEPGDVVRVTP